MVDVTYSYSVNDDFQNSIVSTSSLTKEIQESSITISLSCINTSVNTCDILFKAELSLGEKNILDVIVSNHSGIEVLEVENPKTEDGKIFVAPNIFPLGVLTKFCGVSDDIENGISGGGELLLLSSAASGDTSKYFRYLDWNYLAGGHVMFTGADFGDWCSFSISAPKTEGVSNTGHGMFKKYPIGNGVNIFVPSSGDGDWDLNLSEKENANVRFTKVKPVPAMGTGFFDWNEITEEVTLNTKGTGGYNLFDQEIPLNEFVSKIPLLGNDSISMIIPAIKPIRILPHWRYKVTLHNSLNKYLKLAVFFYMARMNSLR